MFTSLGRMEGSQRAPTAGVKELWYSALREAKTKLYLRLSATLENVALDRLWF